MLPRVSRGEPSCIQNCIIHLVHLGPVIWRTKLRTNSGNFVELGRVMKLRVRSKRKMHRDRPFRYPRWPRRIPQHRFATKAIANRQMGVVAASGRLSRLVNFRFRSRVGDLSLFLLFFFFTWSLTRWRDFWSRIF